MKRNDRLSIIAQICTDNNVNPSRGNYAGLVRQVCVTHLSMSQNDAKKATRDLTTAYYTDRWRSLLQTEEETVEGNTGFEPNRITLKMAGQDREALHRDMENLTQKPLGEMVQKVETQKPMQSDGLTDKQKALILRGIAQRDSFNGVGRIILSYARDALDMPKLQIHELMNFWRTQYPLLDADYKSNVLCIYWDGKDTVRDQRQLERIVQPTAPKMFAGDNPPGDIEEDDEGVVDAVETGSI